MSITTIFGEMRTSDLVAHERTSRNTVADGVDVSFDFSYQPFWEDNLERSACMMRASTEIDNCLIGIEVVPLERSH